MVDQGETKRGRGETGKACRLLRVRAGTWDSDSGAKTFFVLFVVVVVCVSSASVVLRRSLWVVKQITSQDREKKIYRQHKKMDL